MRTSSPHFLGRRSTQFVSVTQGMQANMSPQESCLRLVTTYGSEYRTLKNSALVCMANLNCSYVQNCLTTPTLMWNVQKTGTGCAGLHTASCQRYTRICIRSCKWKMTSENLHLCAGKHGWMLKHRLKLSATHTGSQCRFCSSRSL